MVTAKHQPCLSRSGGINFTDSFDMVFIIGLIMQLGDFINANVLQIIFRIKKQ